MGDRVLSQLLHEMDGIEPLKKVIIVAATNRPDLIDPALMRPGRIDRILYVGPPNQAAREDILQIHTRKMPLHHDVVLGDVAQATNRFSGAELAALVREAALCAIQEDPRVTHVHDRHFQQARRMVCPQITDHMLAFFHSYRESHRGV